MTFNQSIYNKGNGNGHGSNGIGAPLIDTQDMPNMMRSLVEPGENIKDLLMRTVLLDVDESTQLALAISYCLKYSCKHQLDSLLYLLAARCSVNETSRRELLMAITGILSPGMLGVKDKSASNLNKKGNDQNSQNAPPK